MSFSDDGWGIHESEVNVANLPKDKVANDYVEVIETHTRVVADKVNKELKTIVDEKRVDEPKNVRNSFPDNKGSTDEDASAKREPLKNTTNVAENRSEDGWGSPLKKQEYRTPVVSKAAASRLPPSRVQVAQTSVPPVNDTFDIDSPRELSPVPPVERKILPPQVKSTASSRKGSDFEQKNSDGKSFGTQNVSVFPEANGSKMVLKPDKFNIPIKSFGTQKPNDPDNRTSNSQNGKDLKPTSFGGELPTKSSAFGGSFGIKMELSTESGSNPSSEKRIKSTGFGGNFGCPKQSESGDHTSKNFGERGPPVKSFGSTDPTKKTSFGSDASAKATFGSITTRPSFGEGPVRSSFGDSDSRPTSFDGAPGTIPSSMKPSGFGSNIPIESVDASTAPSGKTKYESASGFGKQVSEFVREQPKPTGFGIKSDPITTASEFGTIRTTFGEEKSIQKPIGFGSSTASFSKTDGFGGGFTNEKTGFGGFGGFGEKASSKSTGFDGMKVEMSSGGFGRHGSESNATPNNEFGTVFGSTKNDSNKQAFGNTIFGGAGSSFGGTGHFGKIDGGFGENDQKNEFGAFNSGNRGTAGYQTGCRNCGEEGHFARDCTNPKKERPCRNCNEIGHFSKDCPQPKVPYGPCRNCGEEGHFSKECTKERVRLEPTEPCRRCGEDGHWGYECPTRPRDLQGNILVPYDVVFTPEADMFAEAVCNDHRINFDQKVVASMGEVDVPDMASFEAFKVLPFDVHENLKRMKMNRPTPIQRAAFFPILHGQDVVACAHTGSGKTLAFLIPLVINLLEDRSNNHDVTDEKPSPRLLIVAPTRELAGQTFNTARQLAFETGLKCGVAYGGYSRSANLQHLRSFDQLGILVATMGRLQDFIDSEEISLAKMKFVVLDEADRMVDSTDFGEEVCKILGPPEERKNQTILFSASFSEHLQTEDLPKFVKQGYTMLQVDKFGTANEKIDQQMRPVAREMKRTELYQLLGIDENTMSILPDARIENEKTLIFVNSVKFCDTLASNISNCGVSCIPMHSHQNQEQRDRTLDDFRRGKYKCMVASNVCARGLNIAELDHVINYDMPDKNGFDEYVNRIGRTARAGFTGVSTAFIDEENDREIIPSLVSVLTEAKKEVPDWLINMNAQPEECADETNEQW